MSQISLKSITGITSITTASSGVDNQLTVHTNDTTERIKITSSGLNVSGVVTATGADINGDIDVDGHTNLDNVNIAGVTTFSSNTIVTDGSSYSITQGSSGVFAIAASEPRIRLIDNESNPNYSIYNTSGVFRIHDETSNVNRFRIASDGKIAINTDTVSDFIDILCGQDRENIVVVRGADRTTEYAAIGVSGGNAVITGGGVGSTNAGISFRTAASGTEDERLRIDSTGRILLGSGATATPKITGPGGLDVSQYGLSICMGGSSGSSGQARANATTKEARLVIPHYTNAEEPLTAIAAFSTSSYNYINYGGGTSLGNVATRHQFYTAANTTTTGGSEKLKIENAGVRSFATFVDTSYHANPDPFADGSGVAYYRMNYNFHDSGFFAKHGTSSDGTAVTGQPHFSLVNSSGEPCWDNCNEGAIIVPNLKDSYPFSMAAWINVSSWPTTGDNDVIMNLSIGNTRVTLCICCWGSVPQDGADFYIMYGGQGHHYFRPSSKPTNEWIHVVYSVVGADNTAHRVYQNGADLTTRGNRGGGHGGSAGWRLGGNANGSERFAIGKIGSIRFFNKALSSSEASALYTNDTFYT